MIAKLSRRRRDEIAQLFLSHLESGSDYEASQTFEEYPEIIGDPS